MSTPQRPMARTSIRLRGTQDRPSGSRGCSLSRVPSPHSGLSIVCPDILTFSHAMLGCGYSFVWSRPEIGDDVPLTVELDRSSPVPLYYQLAQAIEAAIRDGELSPGDRFENELALAKAADVVAADHAARNPGTRRQGSAGAQARGRHAGGAEPRSSPRGVDQPLRRPRPRRPGADDAAAGLPRRPARRRGRPRTQPRR